MRIYIKCYQLIYRHTAATHESLRILIIDYYFFFYEYIRPPLSPLLLSTRVTTTVVLAGSIPIRIISLTWEIYCYNVTINIRCFTGRETQSWSPLQAEKSQLTQLHFPPCSSFSCLLSFYGLDPPLYSPHQKCNFISCISVRNLNHLTGSLDTK